jgi:hypothetical protein
VQLDRTRACPDTSKIESSTGGLHCSACNEWLLDLRHVTERQAETLLDARRAEGRRACIRIYTDSEGYPSYLVEPATPRRMALTPLARMAPLALAATLGACDAGTSRAEPESAHHASSPVVPSVAPGTAAVSAPVVVTTPVAAAPSTPAVAAPVEAAASEPCIPGRAAAPDAGIDARARHQPARTRPLHEEFNGGIFDM